MSLIFIYTYYRLGEGPGVARGKKYFKNFEKKISSFFSLLHGATRCPQKNFSSIGQAVWSAIRNKDMNVLFFYIDDCTSPAVARSYWSFQETQS